MKNLILFIFIFLISIFLYFNCYKSNIVEINSKKKGNTLLIVAGIHGDETTGVIATNLLKNLLQNNLIKLKTGKIILIETLNKCGYMLNNRYYTTIPKNKDLNSTYDNKFPVTKPVIDLVKKADIIIELHDGWGFKKKHKKSVGSSINFHHIDKSIRKELLKLLNKDIKIDYKKFTENTRRPYKNSLRYVAKKLNKKYLLVETTGQDDLTDLSPEFIIYPLNIRVNQVLLIFRYLLEKYKFL